VPAGNPVSVTVTASSNGLKEIVTMTPPAVIVT
jgi:hypothetical protein